MRLVVRVTRGTQVLQEIPFEDERKGDIRRAVAKLVRRFRNSKQGPKFSGGTSISIVNAD